MNKRLNEIRTYLGLSQEEFGKRLGVGKSAISYLESGKNTLTEQMIKLICKEFNVSYAWLVLGDGTMFSDLDASIMAKIDYIMSGESTTAQKLFKAFAKLDEEDWKVVEKIIDSLTP